MPRSTVPSNDEENESESVFSPLTDIQMNENEHSKNLNSSIDKVSFCSREKTSSSFSQVNISKRNRQNAANQNDLKIKVRLKAKGKKTFDHRLFDFCENDVWKSRCRQEFGESLFCSRSPTKGYSNRVKSFSSFLCLWSIWNWVLLWINYSIFD